MKMWRLRGLAIAGVLLCLTPAWRQYSSESRVDGTKRIAIERLSARQLTYSGWLKYHPEITIECRSGTTMVWLDFERVMDGYNGQTVVYKVDEHPPRRVWMHRSTSYKALGLSGGPAINFAKQLIAKKMLHLRAVPHGEGGIEISFELDGLEKAIQPVAELCKWPGMTPATKPKAAGPAKPLYRVE